MKYDTKNAPKEYADTEHARHLPETSLRKLRAIRPTRDRQGRLYLHAVAERLERLVSH
jgi:hypothetical protein